MFVLKRSINPTCRALRAPSSAINTVRPISSSRILAASSDLENPPKGQDPQNPSRQPPPPPPQESERLRDSSAGSASFLGTTKRLPEFALTDKVVLVSGAARGLGLTQAEALLEAGATVYALDRLAEPSPDFARVQKRAAEELGTTLYYRQIDVRDVEGLNRVVEDIANMHGRLDGLLAAAGIQQETTALEYTAKDANMMFEVNITGVFMTSQAVAKQMIRFGNGGSIALIASMSATIANRVCLLQVSPSPFQPLLSNSNFLPHLYTNTPILTSSIHLGSNLPSLQRLQSRRRPTSPQPGLRMGRTRNPRQHHLPRLHRHRHGRRTVSPIPRKTHRVAQTEHVG